MSFPRFQWRPYLIWLMLAGVFINCCCSDYAGDSECLTRLKALSALIQSQRSTNHGLMPSVAVWHSLVVSQQCPKGSQYAFNGNLLGTSLDRIKEPQSTILVAEMPVNSGEIINSPSQLDLNSHPRRVHVITCDFHVRAIPASQVGALYWK